jgi:DNA (cytosine-5)-methyltransferase 1
LTAYYNERDAFAAAWLRELIAAGHIAPGVVDERPIQEVEPSDVEGFTQCHFFAGIGVWSHALRCAGWPDDRRVWTGSCPCQPFSASGKRRGFDDERHLWPIWFPLIRECRPDVLFGEQVSSPDGLGWLDVVSADMEAQDYAFGALDTCAAGVGAPHIRNRIYFVAESDRTGRQPQPHGAGSDSAGDGPRWARREWVVGARGDADELADSVRAGRADGRAIAGRGQTTGGGGSCELAHTTEARSARREDGRADSRDAREGVRRVESQRGSALGVMGDACGSGLEGRERDVADGAARATGRSTGESGAPLGVVANTDGGQPRHGHVQPGWQHGQFTQSRGASFWSDAEWIACRDGKARPTKPGIFPLASGVAGRVGMLRGAGNALCSPQAQAFIEAYLDVERERFEEAI